LLRGQRSGVATSESSSAPQPWRRWLRRVAIVVLVLAILPSGFIVAALVEPDYGPGAQVIEFTENQIRQNEDLHYNIHRVLGKVFSFCPCTARLSRSQYQKAFYHRPRPLFQP
jgi:hypothetical protein